MQRGGSEGVELQWNAEREKMVITADDVRNYVKERADIMTTLLQHELILWDCL